MLVYDIHNKDKDSNSNCYCDYGFGVNSDLTPVLAVIIGDKACGGDHSSTFLLCHADRFLRAYI